VKPPPIAPSALADTGTEITIDSALPVLLDFARDHQVWAVPLVFGLAFGESLAFVSLILPATAILFAIGGIMGASGIAFWPIWFAAVVGAILGDWVSYWFGFHYKQDVARMWPFSRRPDLLPRGERFFRTWGIAGIFLGRFFGPLRSVVPLVAGIFAMPLVPFQVANVLSALVWATGILAPGVIGFRWLM
jgi:membrane protein DedA with SNARE-associated domain